MHPPVRPGILRRRPGGPGPVGSPGSFHAAINRAFARGTGTITSRERSPALEALAAAGLDYRVVRRTPSLTVEEAAAKRGLPVQALIKTLVVRRREESYLFVLVPGDRSIDWAKLRRHLGERRLSLPDAEEARRVTGYERGAITPFGASRTWPVVADASLLEHDVVSLGGGSHGVSVLLPPRPLVSALDAVVADVTKGRR